MSESGIPPCPHCKCIWPRLPEDCYCAVCGAELQYALFLPSDTRPPKLYKDSPDTAELTLALKNLHSDALRLSEIRFSSQCMVTNGLEMPQTIAQNAELPLRIYYVRENLPEDADFPCEITVSAVVESGGVRREAQWTYTVFPAPALSLDAVVLSAETGSPDEAIVGECTFVLENESSGNVQELVSLDPENRIFDVSLELEDGQGLLPGKFTFRLDATRAIPGQWTSYPLELRFKNGRLPLPVEMRALLNPVRLKRPDLEVYTGHRDWVPIVLESLSEDPIIASVTVSGVTKDGAEFNYSPDLIDLEMDEYAKGGRLSKFRKEDLLLFVNGAGLVPGQYDVAIDVFLGGDLNQRITTILRMRLTEPQEYPEFVAVDFGTSNTCCAYRDPATREIRTIPLGESDGANAFQEFIPTALSIEGVHDRCLIGDAAKNRGHRVELIKLKLGTEAPIYNNLPPAELAFLYIRQVLWRAEKEIGMRIRNIVLSHPSRFTNRQINHYRYIVHRLKREKLVSEFKLIDEGTAGAFSAIAQGGDDAKFSVFVVDIGGGTTDMTYGKVVKDFDENTVEIWQENVGGLRTLGGVNANFTVMDMFIERFRAELQSTHADLDMSTVRIPYTDDDFRELDANLDPTLLNELRSNKRFFEDDCERIKVELNSDENVRYVQPGGIFKAYVPGHNGALGITKQIELTSEDFRNRISDLVHPAVGVVDKLLSESHDGSVVPPDLIVLAGGSARLNPVKQMISAAYPPPTKVIYAERLKACVATGACKYALALSMGAGYILHLMKPPRSNFGVEAFDIREGRPVFEKLVSKGTDLPVETVFPGKLVTRIQAGLTYTVLENFGFQCNTENNRDLETLAVFRLTKDMLQGIPQGELNQAQIRFSVDKNERVALRITFPSRPMIEFQADDWTVYEIED